MKSPAVEEVADMSLQTAQSLLGGAIGGQGSSAAPKAVEVEHMDFAYLRSCEDGKRRSSAAARAGGLRRRAAGKHVERILKRLRTGKEGHYPELEAFAEERLRELRPASALLKKYGSTDIASLPKGQRADLMGELAEWTASMNEQEAGVAGSAAAAAASRPPVRGTGTIRGGGAEAAADPAPAPAKPRKAAIPGGDFRAWDKYDVDAAVEEVDAAEPELPPPRSAERTVINKAPAVLPSAKVANVPASAAAKAAMAAAEKDKGNEAFRAGDYAESIAYYSRSLSVLETAAVCNNRALAYIKLKRYPEANDDCDRVLAAEPGNYKAAVRKATALKDLGRDAEAEAAAMLALEMQPTSKEAAKLLKALRAKRATAGGGPVPAAPGVKSRRMQIVEDSEEEEEEEEKVEEVPTGEQRVAAAGGDGFSPAPAYAGRRSGCVFKFGDRGLGYYADPTQAAEPTPPTAPAARRIMIEEDSDEDESGGEESTPAPAPAPAAEPLQPPPARAQQAKDDGKVKFAAGQYAEAAELYSQALKALRESGCSNRPFEGTLLCNRAACHLKNGTCSEAIKDCDAALAVDSGSATALLRRGVSNETLERYRAAYQDYQEVLARFPGNASARTGASRVAKALATAEGPGWRKTYEASKRPASGGDGSGSRPPVARVSSPAAAESSPAEMERRYNAIMDEGNALVAAATRLSKAGDANGAVANFRAAISKYDACVKLDAKKTPALSNRALCRLRVGDAGGARADADAVLALDPDNSKAAFRRGQALEALGEFHEAKTAYAGCLRRDPGNGAVKAALQSACNKIAELEPVPGEDKLAAIAAKRAQLEQERDEMERELAAAQAAVAGVEADLSKTKAAAMEGEAKLASASKEIDNAVSEVKGDVKFMEVAAAAEAAEAAEERKRAHAAAAVERRKQTQVGGRDSAAGGQAKPVSPTKAAAAGKASPMKPVQFMRSVRRSLGKPQELAGFLSSVPPALLPKLFSNQLEADHVEAVLAAVDHLDPEIAFEVLTGVSETERFDMVVAFLSAEDVARGEAAFSRMRAAVAYGTAPAAMTSAVIDELLVKFTP